MEPGEYTPLFFFSESTRWRKHNIILESILFFDETAASEWGMMTDSTAKYQEMSILAPVEYVS